MLAEERNICVAYRQSPARDPRTGTPLPKGMVCDPHAIYRESLDQRPVEIYEAFFGGSARKSIGLHTQMGPGELAFTRTLEWM